MGFSIFGPWPGPQDVGQALSLRAQTRLFEDRDRPRFLAIHIFEQNLPSINDINLTKKEKRKKRTIPNSIILRISIYNHLHKHYLHYTTLLKYINSVKL